MNCRGHLGAGRSPRGHPRAPALRSLAILALPVVLAACQIASPRQCPADAPGCDRTDDPDWSERAAEEAEDAFNRRGPGPLR